jgi:hypothetical protein
MHAKFTYISFHKLQNTQSKQKGYHVEILEGYLFDSTNLFANYIDDLFTIKLT